MSADREQEMLELTAAYALGALGPEETRAFEAWLATSPAGQREVAEYREVGALMALGATAIAGAGPSTDLRQRVIERATSQKARSLPAPKVRTGSLVWIGLAASLIAVAGLGLQQRALRRQLAVQTTSIAALEATLATREARLAQREAELNSLLDPNIQLTRMGTPGTREPVVQLFWNRRSNLVLIHAFQLAPTAANRAYQLWFIPKNGKPIPSVTFNTEPSGHGLVQQIKVPEGMELTAAALTEEPEGGSPQPTTTPFLVGTLSAS
ncbi:MAG: anti-sigma factor [Gemmatimonadota bacterium]|nr:anti-sigma factor [Gemmatimonadota bacterium]